MNSKHILAFTLFFTSSAFAGVQFFKTDEYIVSAFDASTIPEMSKIIAQKFGQIPDVLIVSEGEHKNRDFESIYLNLPQALSAETATNIKCISREFLTDDALLKKLNSSLPAYDVWENAYLSYREFYKNLMGFFGFNISNYGESYVAAGRQRALDYWNLRNKGMLIVEHEMRAPEFLSVIYEIKLNNPGYQGADSTYKEFEGHFYLRNRAHAERAHQGFVENKCEHMLMVEGGGHLARDKELRDLAAENGVDISKLPEITPIDSGLKARGLTVGVIGLESFSGSTPQMAPRAANQLTFHLKQQSK